MATTRKNGFGVYVDAESGEIRDREDERRLSTAKDLILQGVDGNSVRYKRFLEIAKRLAVDQGGIGQLSEARIQLLRRFAASCVIAEQLEIDLFNGKEVDIGLYVGLTSILARLGARIGIDRRARQVTPNLTDYLELPAQQAQ